MTAARDLLPLPAILTDARWTQDFEFYGEDLTDPAPFADGATFALTLAPQGRRDPEAGEIYDVASGAGITFTDNIVAVDVAQSVVADWAPGRYYVELRDTTSAGNAAALYLGEIQIYRGLSDLAAEGGGGPLPNAGGAGVRIVREAVRVVRGAAGSQGGVVRYDRAQALSGAEKIQARANIGAAIGSDVQAYDADLAAFAGVTSAANKLFFFTGAASGAVCDFTAFARTLLAGADAAAVRTALSLNNVENKSSATIRGELTAGNVTTALTYTPTSITGLTGVQSTAGIRTGLSLDNVENKSSATIRGELTSGNVTTALTFTPTSITGLTGMQSVAGIRTGLSIDNVENKSSATIRGELTSGNVTGALTYTPTSITGLTGVQSTAGIRTGLSIDNVENKSSATIRGELTAGNVTAALTYTPTSITGLTGVQSTAGIRAGLAIDNVENKSSATIRGELTSGNVTTALTYTPLDAATRGAANGVASLGGDGKIPAGQLPSIAITDTFEVASQAAMLALTAQRGDVAVRSDLNKSFILKTDDPTTLADWVELKTPTDAVLSVAGLTGAVSGGSLKSALSLDNVENKSSATIRGELTALNVTGALTYTPTSITGLTGVQTPADIRAGLGLEIGSTVQAYDADLAAFAGVTSAANKLFYFTGAAAGALCDLTAFGRSVIAAADASAGRTALGLGTAATQASTDFATAAQGTKADNAVQPGDLAAVATSGSYNDLTDLPGGGGGGVDLLAYFGDGSDGDVTISGSVTLTRDMAYNNLTIASGAVVDSNSCIIRVKGNLDLTAAPAGWLTKNGGNAVNASTATGGAAAPAITNTVNPSPIQAGNIGSAGGSGSTAAGSASPNAGGNRSFTSRGGPGGAGGTTGGNAGGGVGTLGGFLNPAPYTVDVQPLYSFASKLAIPISANGGTGGGGGGGDGVNAGGGGGGNGGQGGFLVIYANTITRGGSTAAAGIQAKGGRGGNGANGIGGNASGGGGGGGGGAGMVWIVYLTLSGTAATNLIDVTGGDGGNGGNSPGTGQGGNGGDAGYSGNVVLANLSTGVVTNTLGAAGATGGARSGATGGTGATAATTQVSL